MYLHTPELRQRSPTAEGGTHYPSTRRDIEGENSMWDLRLLYVHSLAYYFHIEDIVLMGRLLYFLPCCLCVLSTCY